MNLFRKSQLNLTAERPRESLFDGLTTHLLISQHLTWVSSATITLTLNL
ncbi:hypothetical protein [Spirosoma daeguense]